MGVHIDRIDFDDESYRRFAARLREDLAAMRVLFQQQGFGVGPTTIGAELEIFLVDAVGAPTPVNEAVLDSARDPQLTTELARFNIECNTRPLSISGTPFATLSAELRKALQGIASAAAPFGARPLTVGVLPTLSREDLGRDALTPQARYQALDAALRKRRKVALRIRGDETLDYETDDISLEGACTSFQVHLRVAPRAFARHYNAAQLATGPVLAVSANSPLFLGRKLWHETRIALFQQSSDDRDRTVDAWDPPRRVSFGHGWVREGALELFEEVVALYEPILPVVTDEAPLELAQRGEIPRLAALGLHNGTVWRWNRPVYGPEAGGHLRIELRALPAGPSRLDMLSSAAFHLGLTIALAEDMHHLLPGMPFAFAARNFYRAAREGIGAQLLWPMGRCPSPEPIEAAALVEMLLPAARQGLLSAGVAAQEVDTLLDIVARRAQRKVTGASWMRNALTHLEREIGRERALTRLVQRYHQHVDTGRPVHEWPEV